MRSLHIFGMGFTQTLGRRSGQVELWLKARQFSGPQDTMLTPFSWRADPEDVAGLLRQAAGRDFPIINGYFYSWGAGWFFPRLAAEMKKRSLSFNRVVLCDPVKRLPGLPSWLPLNPMSLTSLPKLKLEDNVRECFVFRQRQNKPRAHDVIVSDPSTVLHSPVDLYVPHEDMEDELPYHDLVLKLIQEATQ